MIQLKQTYLYGKMEATDINTDLVHYPKFCVKQTFLYLSSAAVLPPSTVNTCPVVLSI